MCDIKQSNKILKKGIRGMKMSKKNIIIGISAHVMLIFYILTQVVAITVSRKIGYFPDAQTIMQILSTCVQLLAGLYGVTITGYIFFLSRLDGLVAENYTVENISMKLKDSFKYLIWNISGNVFIAIILYVILMYYPMSTNVIPEDVYRLMFNEFLVFVLNSVILIMGYSASVVESNNLTKEAYKGKDIISNHDNLSGNVLEFMSIYGQIEACCRAKLTDDIILQLQEVGKNRLPIIIELLEGQNLLKESLIRDLHKLHEYYSCMVNCTPLYVTQEMCEFAQHILVNLREKALDKQDKEPLKCEK